MNDINFWENSINEGFYDKTVTNGLNSNRDIQSQWHDITYKNVLKKINQDLKVLDYACGSGTFLGRYLQSEGFGTDIIDKQVDYANKLYGDNNIFFYLTNENIVKNSPYEVVTILGLLEFLNDSEIKKIFNELKDVIKNDSKIIITTPNYGSFMKYIEKIANKIGDVDYSSVNVSDFNEKKLYKTLEDNGFVDIKISKVVNFGVFFSVLSNRIGSLMNSTIANITFNKFGYILLAEAYMKK
tara:strand:- start:706 stop:1428 length:723 start_codon:yes stop_codon:yes gene_type:complete